MSRENAAASERLTVAASVPLREGVRACTQLRVDRWDADQTEYARRMLGLPDWMDITPAQFALAGAGGVRPYATSIHDDANLLTTAGWGAMLGGVAGTSITNKFGASNGRIGVGTSSTAALGSDTHLGGDTGGSSTTSYYQLVSGAPTISTAGTGSDSDICTLTFAATFGTGVANFAWAEFGTDNYTTSGVTTTGLGASYIFFNHGISSQGTKASGQTWTATETITFGYAAIGNIL